MFLVTEYDPIFFVMPALMASAGTGTSSCSPYKKDAGGGVFQSLEQILSYSIQVEQEELGF